MSHILIVDDEPATSWALAEGLADDGHTSDTFGAAEDAWAWLQTGHSNLVISDLRLPGMTGLELARRLRRGRHAQPVILVTAYATDQTLREARTAGIVECFSKPFAMDGLRRAVARAIEAADDARRRRKRGTR